MRQHLLISLSSIVVLGITAQWLAWRVRLPSILFLLLSGIVAGPVLGVLDTEAVLGPLLFPVVSLAVAVILFEGGLSLQLSELRAVGQVVRNLITVGMLVTWVINAAAAYWLLGLDMPLATLLSAILVVSGPTVVGPLLRHVRPRARLSATLKWESILIDPLGVLLAVLVFEFVAVREVPMATVVRTVLLTFGVGGGIGFGTAALFIVLLRRYWLPDYLDNAVALALVVLAFTLADFLQSESGLVAVTVMGIVLANQRYVPIHHIIRFKEDVGILLVSALFLLLAARLNVAQLTSLHLLSVVFLGIVIGITRPLVALLSTVRAGWEWRERLFLACLAPRGIVAAAMASFVALELEHLGYAEATQLVPLTFLVIIGTVLVYGTMAAPLARYLALSEQNPQGVLLMGANRLARAIARVLHEEGYKVLLVDTNRSRIATARLEGLPTYHGNLLTEDVMDNLELDGIGRLLALTSNDEANALGALHLAEIFGRAEVYQVATTKTRWPTAIAVPAHLRGRLFIKQDITYAMLEERMLAGATIKTTRLTSTFDYGAFQQLYGNTALPLFVIHATRQLIVWTADQPPSPQPGQTLISLALPDNARCNLDRFPS